MTTGKRWLCCGGWAALWLLTGCPLATHPPAKRPPPVQAPAPGQSIVPNNRVNPVILIDSDLPDTFTFVDTVRSSSETTVSVQANDVYQSLMQNFFRVKFPQTANPAAASPPDAPRIVVRLTYLNLDPRWTMGNTFMVLAQLDFLVDVKIAGRLHEQEFHASGPGMRDNAYKEAVTAALRNGIPQMNEYFTSLNL